MNKLVESQAHAYTHEKLGVCLREHPAFDPRMEAKGENVKLFSDFVQSCSIALRSQSSDALDILEKIMPYAPSDSLIAKAVMTDPLKPSLDHFISTSDFEVERVRATKLRDQIPATPRLLTYLQSRP